MLKVLHINDYASGGGAEVVVDCLIREQRSAGLQVELLTSEQITCHQRTPLGYISSKTCVRAVRERIASFQPDVIHLHNYYHELSPGILVPIRDYARARGAPVVMSAHDHHFLCPNSGFRWFAGRRAHLADAKRLKSLWYLLSRRWDHRGLAYSQLKLLQHVWNYRIMNRRSVVDIAIAPSAYLGDLFTQAGFKSVVVPNPLTIKPAPPARPHERLRFVFVGRIEREKGLYEFIAAMPHLSACELVVVGAGDDRARCEALAAELGLQERVHFTGRVPTHEVAAHIAAAHVLVLLSLVPEAGGLAVIEALACGTNVLTSQVGGAGEIVRRTGIGFTCTPDDPPSVRHALTHILDAFERGTLNTFDAGPILEAHDPARFAQRIGEIYAATIRMHRGGRGGSGASNVGEGAHNG